MKREFCHTRRGYPPTCCWGGIHRSTTAFYRIHPRLKKPWYSAKADKNLNKAALRDPKTLNWMGIKELWLGTLLDGVYTGLQKFAHDFRGDLDHLLSGRSFIKRDNFP